MGSEDTRDILTALSAAGVEHVVVGAHALAAHGLVRATGDVDILTRIAGVRFDRAWRGRMTTEIEGVPVAVLGFDDLIAAKRASARKRSPGSAKALQDEADLAWLLRERARRRRG